MGLLRHPIVYCILAMSKRKNKTIPAWVQNTCVAAETIPGVKKLKKKKKIHQKRKSRFYSFYNFTYTGV